MVRDRNNEHDRNAVAVVLADDYTGGPGDFDFDFILGYIPRSDTTRSNFLPSERPLAGRERNTLVL